MSACSRLKVLEGQLRSALTMGPRDELVKTPGEFHLSDEDMEALRLKYDYERDIRLEARPGGNADYDRIVDLAQHDERYAKMLEDPYPQRETQHPVTSDTEVCIVGTGFGGLCAGARLVEAGVSPDDIRILDKAGDVGGTWYWNRYPGAMCDVESYVYMPLLEETGVIPSQKYAQQQELMSHSQKIAEHYGLYKNAVFGAGVTGMEWSDAEGKYTITTNKGDCFKARFVVMNFGTFTQPKLPGVPGVGSFKGHVMHTSRWDYDYTGGSSAGGLDKLKDKRVAIIGTGATAIQVTPHLGKHSKQLYVFQRTPSSVDIRNQTKTTPEFIAENLSQPGWQADRQVNFYEMVQTNKGAEVDLVNDGWTDIIRNQQMQLATATRKMRDEGKSREEITKMRRRVQYQQMEKVRSRCQIVVDDKETAENLKPWYNQFCKRPCFHDDYLATFNRETVQLIHDPLGVERITEKGVMVGGVEFEVDCIVMATGFDAPAASSDINAQQMGPARLGYDVIGRGGQRLSDKWGAPDPRHGDAEWNVSGAKTFESYHSAGFPNLCMQNAPQGVFTINFCYQLDEASKHFAHIISETLRRGKKVFDVRPEAEAEYLAQMWKRSPPAMARKPGCTPGYYNNEGKVGRPGTRKLAGQWPGLPKSFFDHCAKKRADNTALDVMTLE